MAETNITDDTIEKIYEEIDKKDAAAIDAKVDEVKTEYNNKLSELEKKIEEMNKPEEETKEEPKEDYKKELEEMKKSMEKQKAEFEKKQEKPVKLSATESTDVFFDEIEKITQEIKNVN